MIKLIKDLESLSNFKEEWTALYQVVDSVTPFQKLEYITASFKNITLNSDKLNIVCIKDDPTNKWIGIFPLILNQYGILEYINARHTDFCVPLIHPDYCHYSIFKEFSEYIYSDTTIRGINWINIPSQSSILSALKPHLKYLIVHDFNYYSSIPIFSLKSDKDYIDSFRFIQAKQRRNLRKIVSKIGENCEFGVFSKNKGDDYPVSCVNQLVDRMIADGIRAREYFSPKMLNFWKCLYENNILTMAIIKENGEPRSCNFMFYDEKHNEYIKWIMLYTENSWNMKINLLIAKYIYDKGDGTINFARGIYDYKLVNFHPDVKPLFRVMIAKTKWGHFKNIVATAFHYSKPIIKSWLGR